MDLFTMFCPGGFVSNGGNEALNSSVGILSMGSFCLNDPNSM